MGVSLKQSDRKYRALISSDWNECLAPCGPFDVIAFTYPHLASELTTVFQQYTGNQITLGKAVMQIRRMVPEPITIEQLDTYLDQSFIAYQGVSDLIAWCRDRNILFMINTTGMIGYFQRVFAKRLIPDIPVLSANPMTRFSGSKSDPALVFDLFETRDKGKNTEAVVQKFGIPSNKIILIGDSGGDGPHFEWGARGKAFLIGSMTKPSLEDYCSSKNIEIDAHFGITCSRGDTKNLEAEMEIDFMELTSIIKQVLDLK
jgi:2-hydroxy-3-keto-5-methylthiopentenyl-1-phosphate phosphatase